MPTVRKPSSFAARKMRMAISLRLAASNFRMGLFFFIPEPARSLREILYCFMRSRGDWSTFFDSQDRQFECTERDASEGRMRRSCEEGMALKLWRGSPDS